MTLDLNIIIPTYGEPDAEGVRPVTGYVEGYHVNTTVADLAEHPELAPFVVVPSTMRRVWAGGCSAMGNGGAGGATSTGGSAPASDAYGGGGGGGGQNAAGAVGRGGMVMVEWVC